MYQPQELFNNLAPEEVNRTLHLSGISEKELYTEDDADRFRECRSLIEQGKTDSEIMNLLPPVVAETTQTTTDSDNSQKASTSKQKKSKKSTNSQSLDISEFLSTAREEGFQLTLSKALGILASCGLKEQEEYTSEELRRFLEACDLLKQGKTEREIAAHFGISESDDLDIQLTIEETELLIQDGGDQLFGEMLRDKAEKHAAVAPALYLKYLAQELASESSQQNWRKLLEMIKARAVGKSQVQFPSKVQTLMPQQLLNSLPPNSENGLTSD
ncbi:hypothetical protein [Nostoc sp. WHI]|uniref:hypothetical protein n=1 Tax=Nostoc sp. WHI TaxID=2650611 RepID=UPI0018C512EB|nr:hypothetical protein [Nostoc sp. WHI]MBG1269766.1 hypothetical protein [Nostoc sp. WHI]